MIEKKKKIKILFIIWSNSYGGGAERQLTNLINSLDKDKYQISLIEYIHSNIKEEKLNSNIKQLQPIIEEKGRFNLKKKIVEQFIYSFPELVRFFTIVGRYDVEVSWNCQIPTFLLSKSNKVKKISWVHSPIWYLKENWQLTSQRKGFAKSTKIVAIADDTVDSIKTLFPEYKDKVVKIMNGYNYEEMDKLSKEYEVERKANFELLYCNRFDENKNPLFLLEVAKILKEKGLKFHINFLGRGLLEDQMKEKVKEYELENNVDIVGFMANPYPYIKNTDLITLTSYAEGFSSTLIEGFHFKKPFISTPKAIPNELYDKDLGYYTDNIEEYASYIEKLYNDKKEYKEKSSSCYEYSKEFELKVQVNNFDKLVDELYKGNK